MFDELRGLERLGERFDTIVLDPPAFAKSKAAVAKARAGYKEINLRALKLLNPGGTLVTCSCSYNINEAAFAEIVYEAAVDAQAHVTVVEKRMQGRDHPVLLGVPETYYLKCFILRKLVARSGRDEPRRALRRLAPASRRLRCEPLLPRRARARLLQRRHEAHAALARAIHRAHRDRWDVDEAHGVRRHADRRSVSRSEVGRHRSRGALPPRVHAARFSRAGSAGWRATIPTNWATTDAMCGMLIGPLARDASGACARDASVGERPQHVGAPRVDCRLDCRSSGPVDEIDLAYGVARRLHPDTNDLIQKAVGWMLREAGKTDPGAARALPARQRRGHSADDGPLRDRAFP